MNRPDFSPLFLERVAPFSVGIATIGNGPPQVLGSGVLLTDGVFTGILTCAHVWETYAQRTEIGLVRFRPASNTQSQVLALGPTQTIVLGEPPWDDPRSADLAFTRLSVTQVADVAARFSILSHTRNLEKFRDGEPAGLQRVDAAFGLIGERTGVPSRAGEIVTTPMHAEFSPGNIIAKENGTLTFECMKYNLPDLPQRFGGLSGGGVWRGYFKVTDSGSCELEEIRLCGTASQQLDSTRLAGQGLPRIGYLFEKMRSEWPV